MPLILWKMGLSHLAPLFQENQINGEALVGLDIHFWERIGLSQREICAIRFYKKLMVSPGFVKEEKKNREEEEQGKEGNDDEEKCVVCWHNTTEKTIELLQEYEIFVEEKLIREENWITPCFIYSYNFGEFGTKNVVEEFSMSKKILILKQIHDQHLKQLRYLL